MFFGEDRIPKIRKMILSKTVEQREAALAELLQFQKADFKAMYEALEGRPMTVRYLDPPLHEFVPTDPEDIAALAKDMNLTVEEVKATCDSLHEFNPMMGHRGCRLAVTYLRSLRCRQEPLWKLLSKLHRRRVMTSFQRS